MNQPAPAPVTPPLAGQAPGIQITNWNPRTKKTLRGFFSVTFPDGMIVHSFALHQNGDSRWVAMPSRSYEIQGEKRFERIVEFTSREIGDQFGAAVLARLDQYFQEHA